MRRKEETVREWWSILSFLAAESTGSSRTFRAAFTVFLHGFLFLPTNERRSRNPLPGIIRTGRDLLTRDENSSQRPLFPRNVRTCRIMARGEKTKEPSCWTNGEDDRALFFLSILSPTFSPTLVSDFAILVGGYFLRKENYAK